MKKLLSCLIFIFTGISAKVEFNVSNSFNNEVTVKILIGDEIVEQNLQPDQKSIFEFKGHNKNIDKLIINTIWEDKDSLKSETDYIYVSQRKPAEEKNKDRYYAGSLASGGTRQSRHYITKVYAQPKLKGKTNLVIDSGFGIIGNFQVNGKK